ncbi:Triosephosphate isomerase OS=Streptomyces glaucescens OX=1907 GN=tpiA PE=3 SV=1 [Streptomyces glaucescens]
MSTRTPLMAGNWKMNLNHLEAIAHVQKLAFALADKDYEAVEVAVLPPFTDLRSVQTLVDGDKLKIKYGAQDISAHDSGAYTGEISGSMLAKLKCTYVAIGHSERRQYHAETDEIVNAKVKAAYKHGLTPILCVGEELEVREAGNHVSHTLAQVEGGLKDLPAEAGRDDRRSPTSRCGPSAPARSAAPRTPRRSAPRSAARSPSCTRRRWPTRSGIQYGGSVKAGNVAEIMAQADIDGALVGGASLDADEFVKIGALPRPVSRPVSLR